jgi:hypothetical protein
VKTIDIRQVITSRVGQELKTPGRNHSNWVLRIEDDFVIVATEKSMTGEPVPIRSVESALKELVTTGQCTTHRQEGCFRGSFFVAFLRSLPEVELAKDPNRAVVVDRGKLDRFLYAEGVQLQSPASPR